MPIPGAEGTPNSIHPRCIKPLFSRSLITVYRCLAGDRTGTDMIDLFQSFLLVISVLQFKQNKLLNLPLLL